MSLTFTSLAVRPEAKAVAPVERPHCPVGVCVTLAPHFNPCPHCGAELDGESHRLLGAAWVCCSHVLSPIACWWLFLFRQQVLLIHPCGSWSESQLPRILILLSCCPRGLQGIFSLWQVMFIIRAPERGGRQDSDCSSCLSR